MTPPIDDPLAPQRIHVSVPMPPQTQIDNSVLAMLVEVRTDLKLLRQELTGSEGQPGRLTKAENDITALKNDNSKMKGWALGIAGSAGAIWAILKFVLHVN